MTTTQIKILGTLRGVNVKSKATQENDEIHVLELKVEVLQGMDRVQEILEGLKSIHEITLDCRQPELPMAKPYKDDDGPEQE